MSKSYKTKNSKTIKLKGYFEGDFLHFATVDNNGEVESTIGLLDCFNEFTDDLVEITIKSTDEEDLTDHIPMSDTDTH